MLLLALVAVATVQLLLAGAEPLCGVRRVRTGKVLKAKQEVHGDSLYFAFRTTHLIRHPCKERVVAYLGRQVFLSTDNFESSLPPLTIPTAMQVGVPQVTSAYFSEAGLLLVINQNVYLYALDTGTWRASKGIEQPVSRISGGTCCYMGNSFCTHMSNILFAYMLGGDVRKTIIYYSVDEGQTFMDFDAPVLAVFAGTLGGIFFFQSFAQLGMLLVRVKKAAFAYSDPPLSSSFGVPFAYNESLEVHLPPGHRGILILWSERTLQVSHNTGQLVSPIMVQQGEKTVRPSIFGAGITIHSIATNENELAFLSREDHLYYGSLGVLSTSVTKLVDQHIWSQEAAVMFVDAGMVEILTPLQDPASPAFDFQKCLVNVQKVLMDPQLKADKCRIELLEGEFQGQIFTIDMNSELRLSAQVVPRPGATLIPMVKVSNPHALGLQANFYDFGTTWQGNTKYKLDIHLKQQYHSGRADISFLSSIKQSTISSLTVDIANKEMSCIDIKPLSALISVGCDEHKRLVVQNKVSACSKGLLDPVALQNNYSYVIEKEAYGNLFTGKRATQDLRLTYEYRKLGCPRLAYYDTPWKPVLELWHGDTFQEVVEAEYVMIEVNGLMTYSYLLTAGAAHCQAQPQNWSTILYNTGNSLFWSREDYMSCHEPNKNNPLQWPEAEYQILGGPTENKIIFEQRNGIYVFLISVVDPYYSYCNLHSTFSVYVYGAYPLPMKTPEVVLCLLMGGMLLTVWLAYMVPKLLHTQRGTRIRQFWAQLCRKCVRCGCLRAKR